MLNSIPHSKPTLSSDDAKKVYQAVHSGNLAQGSKTLEFEKKFSHFSKVRYAAAVNCGTSALHLALLALKIKKGDQVILPSYVCTALLNAVNYTGATARIVDVEPEDFNISVTELKKKVNKKTKAIIVPHMFGQSADLKSLLALKIPLVEDCAQAVGATFRNKPVGSFGTLSIYSFYATKMMTTGEGGMVTTSDRRLIKRIKDLRDYDQKQDYKVRYNYKMTDFQAALGLKQLSKLPKMIKQRRVIARTYNEAFKDGGIQIPLEQPHRQHVYFRYVIKVKRNKDRLIKKLKNKGINCASPVDKPLHQYLRLKNYPASDQLMKKAISIPIYPSLSKSQIKHIVANISSLFPQ